MTETSDGHGLLAGRYRLIEVIGRGGMGVVWHARDELIDRAVAVKQVHAPIALSENERAIYRQRALAEARNAGRISHAGVVAIHDIVPAQRDGEAVSLVMELIAAPTLHDVLTQGTPLSPDRVALIALGLREALETAHFLGVVHRDVKPANVHLLPRDRIKLVDFGIAHALDDPRLTRTGTMGTGAYMAPELFDGQAPSASSDWWSLGVTLRQLLTGVNVFEQNSPAATMRAILFDPVPAIDCPDPLSTVIDGLLTRDPESRLTGTQAHDLLADSTGVPPHQTSPGWYAKGGTAKWPTGPTRRHAPADEDPGPDHDARYERAAALREAGDLLAAITEFTSLLHDSAQGYGADHRETLTIRYELARLRGETGDAFTAVHELEEVWHDAARRLRPDDRLSIDIRHELARWRAGTGHAFAAINELEQLRSEVASRFGPDDSLTLDIRLTLAACRGEYHDPLVARVGLEELLRDSTRVLGAEHRNTLDIMHTLARLRGETGACDTAIEELRQVLQLRNRLLGSQHPDTFETRRELAKLSDPNAAVEALEQLRRDEEQASGADRIHTLETRHELAKCRGKADGPQAAVNALERLVQDLARVLGADHASTFTIRMTLAEWRGRADGAQAETAEYELLRSDIERAMSPDHFMAMMFRLVPLISQVELGDFDMPAVERILIDAEQVLGTEHLLAIGLKSLLVYTRAVTSDDLVTVKSELEGLLSEQERVLGSRHAITLVGRALLPRLHGTLGDPQQAARDLELLLDDQVRVLGPEHPDTLHTRRNLADWTGEAIGLRATIDGLRELLPDQERVLGADHRDTLDTRNLLARTLGRDGDQAAAVDELARLLDDQSRVLGPEHPDTVNTRKDLEYWQAAGANAGDGPAQDQPPQAQDDQ